MGDVRFVLDGADHSSRDRARNLLEQLEIGIPWHNQRRKGLAKS